MSKSEVKFGEAVADLPERGHANSGGRPRNPIVSAAMMLADGRVGEWVPIHGLVSQNQLASMATQLKRVGLKATQRQGVLYFRREA